MPKQPENKKKPTRQSHNPPGAFPSPEEELPRNLNHKPCGDLFGGRDEKPPPKSRPYAGG